MLYRFNEPSDLKLLLIVIGKDRFEAALKRKKAREKDIPPPDKLADLYVLKIENEYWLMRQLPKQRLKIMDITLFRGFLPDLGWERDDWNYDFLRKEE